MTLGEFQSDPDTRAATKISLELIQSRCMQAIAALKAKKDKQFLEHMADIRRQMLALNRFTHADSKASQKRLQNLLHDSAAESPMVNLSETIGDEAIAHITGEFFISELRKRLIW